MYGCAEVGRPSRWNLRHGDIGSGYMYDGEEEIEGSKRRWLAGGMLRVKELSGSGVGSSSRLCFETTE